MHTYLIFFTMKGWLGNLDLLNLLVNIMLLVDALPPDLYGFFVFTDDLFFYTVRRGFRPNPSGPLWSAFKFTVLTPVPTYTGKFAANFDNTANTAVVVICNIFT